MSNKDLYQILGVARNADTAEIRAAYKQMAKEHHPDKGGDSEKFKEISQAYEILGDDAKRQNYDMTGSTSDQPEMGPFGGGPFGGGPFGGGPFGGIPFGGMPDMFAQMFGGMPGMSGMPGMPGQNRKREGKGPGKTQDLPLRISDYYHGRNLSVKLGRQTFCKDCKGSGAITVKPCDDCSGQGVVRQMVNMGPIQMVGHSPCGACRGKGQQTVGQCITCNGRSLIPEEKTLEIKVEPGMMSGNTVVFTSACSDHPQHAEAGDVTVVLRDADEDGMAASWKREGTKLKTSITLNLSEALLGTVRILQGHPGFANGVPVEIPAGIQNMWTGTVPGLGMPIRGTPKFGDAYITVLITPTADELAAVKSASVTLKTIMPTQPETPTTSETTRVGRWSSV